MIRRTENHDLADPSYDETILHFHRDNPELKEQFEVFWQALKMYEQRNQKYKDVWVRYGWRGCLVQARMCCERAWNDLWDAPVDSRAKTVVVEPGQDPIIPIRPETDDLIDLINYTVFCIRAVRAGNRDGTGGWWR